MKLFEICHEFTSSRGLQYSSLSSSREYFHNLTNNKILYYFTSCRLLILTSHTVSQDSTLFHLPRSSVSCCVIGANIFLFFSDKFFLNIGQRTRSAPLNLFSTVFLCGHFIFSLAPILWLYSSIANVSDIMAER